MAKYSDSVEFTNGCLYYTLLFLLLFCLAPLIICVIVIWWFVAWILGLIYPGKEFFPIGRVLEWFARLFKF